MLTKKWFRVQRCETRVNALACMSASCSLVFTAEATDDGSGKMNTNIMSVQIKLKALNLFGQCHHKAAAAQFKTHIKAAPELPSIINAWVAVNEDQGKGPLLVMSMGHRLRVDYKEYAFKAYHDNSNITQLKVESWHSKPIVLLVSF